jgi:hypothetical protein
MPPRRLSYRFVRRYHRRYVPHVRRLRGLRIAGTRYRAYNTTLLPIILPSLPLLVLLILLLGRPLIAILSLLYGQLRVRRSIRLLGILRREVIALP